MKKYEPGDTATFYFVVFDDDDNKRIVGWTDDKMLAKFYMEFHNCKRMDLKSKTATVEELYQIINENVHDEINIYNFIIRDSGKKNKTTTVSAPATETEWNFVMSETNTFMESRIAYGALNEIIPFLKDKYQRALRDILLPTVIMQVVHNKRSKQLEQIEFDQLMILYNSFPDMFGR